MNGIENLKRISKTINNNIFRKDYLYKNLNWIHAIRIIIFGYEHTKYTNHYLDVRSIKENNFVKVTPITSLVQTINKRINRWIIYEKIKGKLKKISKIFTLIGYVITLVRFNTYAWGRRILNSNKTINFSHDNFDVQYNKSFFNPYSDNINIKEKAVKLCLLQLEKREELKRAYYKPYIINNLLKAYIYFFTKSININTEFLKPIKEIIINEEAFIYLKINVSLVYKNYLFFTYVLKQLKPTRVYLDESYNIYALGLIAAAKKLGIQTIEQQHGIIYPLHSGYCYNYTNLSQTDFVCDQLLYYTPLLIDRTKKGWTFHPKLIEVSASPAYQVWLKFKNSSNGGDIQKLKIKLLDIKL